LASPNSVGVGSSVSTFAYLGAIIAFYLQNWDALSVLNLNTCQKILNLVYIIMIALTNLLVSFSSIYVDRVSYPGAFMFGFLAMFVLHSPIKRNDGVLCDNKIWYWISLILGIGLYLLFILLFVFVVSPININSNKSGNIPIFK
jgi:hypothetical protein